MTIKHNGKEITLTPEQEKVLFGEDKHRTGYERVKKGGVYFTDSDLEVQFFQEDKEDCDDDWYGSANYYSDETVARNNIRTDALMRKLRRFSAEHEGWLIDWKDDLIPKYYIYYSHLSEGLETADLFSDQCVSEVYFCTEEIAREAIAQFNDELTWYFTEYKWVL